MAYDKSSYDKQYAKDHIKRKFIPFNDTVPEDVALLEWINKQPNATAYIKELVKCDIKHRFMLSNEKDPVFDVLFSKNRSQNGSQTGRQ